ncbi:MAG: hypothetical protein AB1640_25045 [bacterium]
MKEIYESLRSRAQEVARELGPPAFYRNHDKEVQASLAHLDQDATLFRLREHVSSVLEDDFGHGLRHALLVTRDAGALAIIGARQEQIADAEARAILRCAQAAGLLHDACRKEPEHALRSAEAARPVLLRFSFPEDEVEEIAAAIANHEAFRQPVRMSRPSGQAVSDCLYDADKFRWGPDNFTDTVWCMASFHEVPFSTFQRAYRQGIQAIEKIKGSFRTPTGRAYGAEIIDMGLEIGRRVISPLIE